MNLLQIIPYWAIYAAGVSAVVGILIYFKDKLALIGAAAVLVAMVVLKSRKQGWDDRELKGVKDAYSALSKAETARRDSDRRNASPTELRKSDGFRRD